MSWFALLGSRSSWIERRNTDSSPIELLTMDILRDSDDRT